MPGHIAILHSRIRGDSVMMFFNERHHFIEKECAECTRHVRIDANGAFNGYFEDRNPDSLLLGRGRYVNGLKYSKNHQNTLSDQYYHSIQS